MAAFVLAGAIAKAFDPLLIIAAFLLCANVRHFPPLVLGGIAIGVAYQFAIIGSFGDLFWQATLPNVIVAVLASLAWVAIFSLIGKRVIDAVENHLPSSRLVRGALLVAGGLLGLVMIVAPGAILMSR